MRPILPRRFKRIRALDGVIAGAAVLRFVLHRYVPVVDLDIFIGSKVDQIAVGCLLAFVDQEETLWRGSPWARLVLLVEYTSISYWIVEKPFLAPNDRLARAGRGSPSITGLRGGPGSLASPRLPCDTFWSCRDCIGSSQRWPSSPARGAS
jgi:hypothetical protein